MIVLPPELPVKLTQDDIAKGIRQSCGSCPVALAATRAVYECIDAGGDPIALVNEAKTISVLVHISTMDVLDHENVIATYILPEAARLFITKYDARVDQIAPLDGRYAVRPFDFVAIRDQDRAAA